LRNVLLAMVMMLFIVGCATTPEPVATEPQPVAAPAPAEEPAVVEEPVQEVVEEAPPMVERKQKVEEVKRSFERSQRKGM